MRAGRPWKWTFSRGQRDPAGQLSLSGNVSQHGVGRWRRCRPARPTAPPSGTARCRRRTAAGCRRDEAREVEGVGDAAACGHARGCCCRSRSHARRRCCRSSMARRARPWTSIERVDVLVRVARAQFGGLLHGDARRDVAVQRIVGAGLVGEQIGDDAAAQPARADLGAVADQADGLALSPASAASRSMRSASSRSSVITSQ